MQRDGIRQILLYSAQTKGFSQSGTFGFVLGQHLISDPVDADDVLAFDQMVLAALSAAGIHHYSRRFGGSRAEWSQQTKWKLNCQVNSDK